MNFRDLLKEDSMLTCVSCGGSVVANPLTNVCPNCKARGTMEIQEKFYNAFTKGRQGTIEVFQIQSKKEFNDILKNSFYNSIRLGITDEKEPKIFGWDGSDAIHLDILREYPKLFTAGMAFMKSNKDTLVIDQTKGTVAGYKGWDVYKHKKEVLKKVKNLIPSIKQVEVHKQGKFPIEELI